MESIINSQNLVFHTGYFIGPYFSWVTSYSIARTHIPETIHLSQTQTVLDQYTTYNCLLHEMVKTNSQSCKKVLSKQVTIKQSGTWPADSLCGTDFFKKQSGFGFSVKFRKQGATKQHWYCWVSARLVVGSCTVQPTWPDASSLCEDHTSRRVLRPFLCETS